MNADIHSKRQEYLKNFPDVENLNAMHFNAGQEIGDSVVELLKQKGLTYDEAYMSLQYAYNKLRYETNLLKLK
ncbi:hypothetical protein [Companilactobacillus muriivasis]|uniref:hypothetical protein n=1 Tax=Companilactobacillus muriivasis TaxID=3081444 RepID=UPI0030C72BEB